MDRKSLSWSRLVVVVAVLARLAGAASELAIHEYAAAVDGVTGEVTLYGQVVAHRSYGIQLKETVRPAPVISLQHSGYHHRGGSALDPNHAEPRAKCRPSLEHYAGRVPAAPRREAPGSRQFRKVTFGRRRGGGRREPR